MCLRAVLPWWIIMKEDPKWCKALWHGVWTHSSVQAAGGHPLACAGTFWRSQEGNDHGRCTGAIDYIKGDFVSCWKQGSILMAQRCFTRSTQLKHVSYTYADTKHSGLKITRVLIFMFQAIKAYLEWELIAPCPTVLVSGVLQCTGEGPGPVPSSDH